MSVDCCLHAKLGFITTNNELPDLKFETLSVNTDHRYLYTSSIKRFTCIKSYKKLRDLMFLGPCIVSTFQYISNKMQRYTVYLYLETALHVSGGIPIHHQERIQPYLQHLVLVTPLLLSVSIVEELELV